MMLSSLIGLDLSILASLAPHILILGGFAALAKLVGVFAKGSVGAVAKVAGFFGFFVGLVLLASGVFIFLGETENFEVWGLLIVTGLGLVLKPLSKVPFSALLGLTAGLACAGLLYWYFPLPETVLGISSLWIYLVVFLVPALIVFLIFKFAGDLAKFFGIILGAWPVMTALGLLCLAQGVLLLMNSSLLAMFEG
ncbi:MAG: hypothetical protein QXZ70_08840, partial [Candidatus Bathyarchaeia archaeon]